MARPGRIAHVRTMAHVTERDWFAWHHDYDHPDTALAQRLAAVQQQIGAALDAAPPGPLRRFTGTPSPLERGARMFTFTGHHPRTGPARHRS